ncbi:MAG: hypothetical protein H0V70_19450 [Ktedonobacteraceae bacterium]|nr:hypothetical protein [Ktedonobacteraceae bacterium]
MYSIETLFANNIEDMSSEDEIDELFSQLLHIDPPATLVDDILATVARLPLPQEMAQMPWDNMSDIIVHDMLRMPS